MLLPTLFKTMTFVLVVMFFSNICLSSKSPIDLMSNLWKKIQNETSPSVQPNEGPKSESNSSISSVIPVAVDRPANDTFDNAKEEKPSWINKYLAAFISAGFVALILLVIIYLFIKKIRNGGRTKQVEDVRMDPYRATDGATKVDESNHDDQAQGSLPLENLSSGGQKSEELNPGSQADEGGDMTSPR